MMISRKSGVRLNASVCVLSVFLASTLVTSKGSSAEREACNLDDSGYLLGQDLSAFSKSEVKIQGYSTEGGAADVYREHGNIRVIKFSLFGETGKSDFNYYFDPINSKRYLVELTDYNYTVLVYQPGLRYASTITSRFVVCEGQEPNYPNVTDLMEAYTRSVDFLAEVRDTLNF